MQVGTVELLVVYDSRSLLPELCNALFIGPSKHVRSVEVASNRTTHLASQLFIKAHATWGSQAAHAPTSANRLQPGHKGPVDGVAPPRVAMQNFGGVWGIDPWKQAHKDHLDAGTSWPDCCASMVNLELADEEFRVSGPGAEDAQKPQAPKLCRLGFCLQAETQQHRVHVAPFVPTHIPHKGEWFRRPLTSKVA